MDQMKMPTYFATKIVGNLGHDARIFDRTCPSCKGVYYSLTTPACPKCGAQLTYLTTKEGKSMSITECAFYPIFGKETSDRWETDTANRKGGMGITWRFKIRNYADKNGVLAEHPISMMLKKGATIELRTYNHPPFATEYESVKSPGKKMMEMMFVILPNYGDSIKVLKQPAVVTRVDANGAVIPPTLNAEMVSAIAAQVTAQVMASLGAKAAVTTATPAPQMTSQHKVAATAMSEEEIDDQVLNSLYGDMDAEMMEDISDHNMFSMANVDPWK